MTIPLLDLQNLSPAALDKACQQWGFFALRGHELAPTLIAEVMDQTKQFFQQSTQHKNSIRRSAENAWGFYDAELTKNRRDWKEIIDIGPAVSSGPLAGSTPQWPDQPGFEECMLALSSALHRVSVQLVKEIGRTLQADTDLTAPFKDHSSFLRLNYYAPCPEPAPADAEFQPSSGQLGISHHTDAGAVTALLQDQQPGLQVYREQRWHTVEPIDNALIINIGDIVQVWSNDRYVAPLHRVLANSDELRISTPYFLNPDYDYDYEPLRSVCGQAQTPHYKPINWGEFRHQRSAGDYADYGTEIQISDYQR